MSQQETFIRNIWYVAGWSKDLAPGDVVARTFLDMPIVLFRGADDRVVALDDRCAHRAAPLSRGTVTGGTIECGYHGLRFDGTGACVYNPHGRRVIPPGAAVRAYPVAEKHSIVWIWLGESPADLDAIPDYSVFDDVEPAFVSGRDHLVIAANYRLITDNLLDLSHVPFLHPGLLGDPTAVAADVEVAVEGRWIWQRRFTSDLPVPSMFDMQFRADGGRVDKWDDIRWTAPGCMILDTGVCDPGADRATGTGYYGIHLLTPETSGSTHYHFAAVRFRCIPRSDEANWEINAKIRAGRRMAFADQDAPMIEAQQLRLDAAGPGWRPALLSVDAGPVRVQRALDALIADEARPRVAVAVG